MNADATRMNRLTLRFADAGLESAFAEEQARKSLRPIRIVLLCLGALQILLWPAFIQVLPYMRSEMPKLVAMALTTVGICYASTHTQVFLRKHQWMILVAACVMSIGIIWVISQYSPQMLVASGFFILVIHLFTIYSLFRLRFPAAAVAGWLSMGLYLGYLTAAGLLPESSFFRHAFVLLVTNIYGMLICYQMDLSARREFLAMQIVAEERARSERLLLNILPASIVERLKESDAAIADHSEDVTVLFADIVGFTPLSARKTPQALVQMLDRIFTEFDALAETHGLEKIKTIGDAYMAAAGLPERRADHAQAAARMALGMLEAVTRLAAETGEALSVRIGLHSGPVVAGVIGRKKFIYDMWGDTVNTASRMESHGVPGAVHCSAATAALLREDFALTARGAVQVEGKGEMHTFLLTSARSGAALTNEAAA